MSQVTALATEVSDGPPELATAIRLTDEISARSEEIDQARRVPADIIAKLNSEGLFNVSVPAAFGGAERSALDVLKVIEQLAYADSAVGWSAMIYLTTATTAASLTPDWAAKIYGKGIPSSLTAGATGPTGRGKKVDGGIEVTGRWAWGSGTHHCDWICGGTLVEDGDDIMRFPSGDPMVHVMFFERDQVHLHDNWDPSGLRGTGSVDFEVNKAFVPQDRWTILGGSKRHFDSPLYRVPFFGLFASAVASVPLGIARRAVDDFAELARKKVPMWKKQTINESSLVQLDLGRAEALVEGARRYLFDVMSEMSDKVARNERPTLDDRRQMRLAASHATIACTQAVDIVYNAGGGTSALGTCSLQRHFRDIHTATQHRMVSNQPVQLAGAVRLTNENVPGVAML